MGFDNEPVEAGYVEKSPPRCDWYKAEVCPQRRCDGNGLVNCRIKERGTLSSRMEGEYKKITFRDSRVQRIPCVSFLVKTVYNSQVASRSA